MQDEIRLYEFDKEEFRSIMREAVAARGVEFDDAEFDKGWDEFVELKRRKGMQ